MSCHVDLKEMGFKLDRLMLRWGWPRSWRRTEITNTALSLLCPWARHLTQGCFRETVLAISTVGMKCICEMEKTLINTEYSCMYVTDTMRFSVQVPINWAATKSSMCFGKAMKSSMNFSAGEANLWTWPAKTCLLQYDITKQSCKVLCQTQGQWQLDLKRGCLCACVYTSVMFTRTIVSFI